jgi:hypothetical protein
MFDTPSDREIKKAMKIQSKFISMVIRNAMEGFRVEHLSDAQMKELNPLIRNAVYTAMYSMQYYKDSYKAKEFMSYQLGMIPDYWEDPELIEGIGE